MIKHKHFALWVSTALILFAWINQWFFLSSLFYPLLLISTAITLPPIAKNAFSALRYKVASIDLLVTIAVVGALFISEIWEAAAVTYLFTLGHYLEAKTLLKTRQAISELLDKLPVEVTVVKEDKQIRVALDDLQLGDHVMVKTGERVAVDGIIVKGFGYLDESSLTGEPLYQQRMVGDVVYASSLCTQGTFVVETSVIGEDSVYGKIMTMIEEAQDKKAKTQKFIETFAQYYTPAIIVLTIIVMLVTRNFELALTLLVISCPGALVIATPVSIVAGIGLGAKNGILFKGGDVIERLSQVKAIAFDKTGTLTQGKPVVTEAIFLDEDPTNLIRLTLSAELHSEHPLATALLSYATKHDIKLVEPTSSSVSIGKGIEAVVDHSHVLLGNQRQMDVAQLSIPQSIQDMAVRHQLQGATTIFASVNHQVVGVYLIYDQLKEEAASVVSWLHDHHIKTVMLTGDQANAANTIAKKIGIHDVVAQCLPEDKANHMQKLKEQYKHVAMVGDGINDAPALALSDFGVAMGGATNHVAMETADIILQKQDLNRLIAAIRISRATVKNMKINIAFAIMVVTLLVIGVLSGHVFLALGMLVHELSVIAVILLAISLRYKKI